MADIVEKVVPICIIHPTKFVKVSKAYAKATGTKLKASKFQYSYFLDLCRIVSSKTIYWLRYVIIHENPEIDPIVSNYLFETPELIKGIPNYTSLPKRIFEPHEQDVLLFDGRELTMEEFDDTLSLWTQQWMTDNSPKR